jgi:hypothetical protein
VVRPSLEPPRAGACQGALLGRARFSTGSATVSSAPAWSRLVSRLAPPEVHVDRIIDV